MILYDLRAFLQNEFFIGTIHFWRCITNRLTTIERCKRVTGWYEGPDGGQPPLRPEDLDEVLPPAEVVDFDAVVGLEGRLTREDEVGVVHHQDGGEENGGEMDAPIGNKKLFVLIGYNTQGKLRLIKVQH